MKCSKRSRLCCAIAAMVALVFVGGPSLFAQSTTDGAIGGNVIDQSRGAVPGATVTVRNVGTNSHARDNHRRFGPVHRFRRCLPGLIRLRSR